MKPVDPCLAGRRGFRRLKHFIYNFPLKYASPVFKDAFQMFKCNSPRYPSGIYAAELPTEDDRARETEVVTDEEGFAAVMVSPGSGVAASVGHVPVHTSRVLVHAVPSVRPVQRV